MANVYKKFTANDVATVPFNAHKQYNFTSASAAANKVTYFNAKYTSESIDIYSTHPLSASVDTINTIKYNQIDHLFYRNSKKNLGHTFGEHHYAKQRRVLYENVNIISIPNGLVGYEIRPKSFYLSSSTHNVVEDTNGNLIIEGTNTNDYITDIESNILNIGPVKGFRRYDLNTIEGYAITIENDQKAYYRDGKPRVNTLSSYSTPDFGDEFDDSYYFNLLKYKNVNFGKKALFRGIFPGVVFDGSTSEIKLGHNDKFNFNPSDDFTITLNALVSHSSDETSYLISKSTTKTVVPSPEEGKAGSISTQTSGALQLKDTLANPQFPFEVYSTGAELFFRRSDGKITTTISSSISTGSMQHISCRVSASQMKIFIDGIASSNSGSDNTVDHTQNQANIYIGNKGGRTNFLSGSLSQINIYNKALTDTQILNNYSSSNGSPYIGNIFHRNGFVTITHPGYQNIVGNITLSEVNQSPAFGPATGSTPAGVLFNNDGTRMYTIGNIDSNKSISQFNLSTAYDVSTAIFHVSKSFSQGTSAVAGHFNNDGSAIFVVDTSSERVRKFTLSTPFDISGGIPYASQVNNASNFGSKVSSPWGIDFNPNGSKMYIAEQGGTDKIYEFDLTTPFDVSTNVLNTELDLNDSFGIATSFVGKGIIVDQEGTRLFVSDSGDEKIYEFFLNNPYRIESAVFVRSYSTGTGNITGLFTANGSIFAADNSNGVVEEFKFNQNLSLDVIQFQGSHLIYENEYQCTIDEHEFNDTLNISARKIRSKDSDELADFATGSLFKPYITTIGLYNEDNELLVVGKLGQPVRASDETDTTLVVRFDT